jgi:hypothetical protein
MRGPHEGSAVHLEEAHDPSPGGWGTGEHALAPSEHEEQEADMMMASGDVLICIEDLDETVRIGSIVFADEVRCDGEYVTLEGKPGCSYHADAFLVAVRRPWWAWTVEDAWRAEALSIAQERLTELDHDAFRNLISETLIARSTSEVAERVA